MGYLTTGVSVGGIVLWVACLWAVSLSVGAVATAQGRGPGQQLGERALMGQLDAWLSQLTANGADSAADEPQQVYRYEQGGRLVFTNIAESVPPSQRAAAAIDLSHVSLNSELGQRINTRLSRAHAELAQSPSCQQARQAEGGLLARGRRFFERHTGSAIFLGLIPCLILLTPAMSRRLDPLAWKRVLMLAIPLLGAAAAFSYSVDRSAELAAQLAQASLAERCSPDAYRRLEAENAPLSLRMSLVRTLDAQRKALDAVAAESQSMTQGL